MAPSAANPRRAAATTIPRERASRGIVVAAALLGIAALGATFAAYLSPSLAMELGSVLAMCAQVIGLR